MYATTSVAQSSAEVGKCPGVFETYGFSVTIQRNSQSVERVMPMRGVTEILIVRIAGIFANEERTALERMTIR